MENNELLEKWECTQCGKIFLVDDFFDLPHYGYCESCYEGPYCDSPECDGKEHELTEVDDG